jgi:hypothetical protein
MSWLSAALRPDLDVAPRAIGGGARNVRRRVIYREGNRQINHFVRAIGLGPHRR